MNERYSALVVGAGPVGLVAALVLAQRGLSVCVIEAGDELGTTSKASTFHPATLDLLHDIGVAQSLIPEGVLVDELQWRRKSGAVIARMPFSHLRGRTRHPYRLHAEQTRLTPILAQRINELSPGAIRFSTRFRALSFGDGGVTALVDGPASESRIHAEYLLAADGAHSDVRTALGIGFPGSFYASRALRVITDEDLGDRIPGVAGITYIRDRDQSCSLLRMSDHWRLIFRVAGSETEQEILDPAFVRTLVDRIVPGLNITGAETYGNRVHVADSYMKDRVLVMGDAAHLTTTAGGMNMNCGIHDAYTFAHAVSDVLEGSGDSGLLDQVAIERRRVVVDEIIPLTEGRARGADGDLEALESAMTEIAAIAQDRASATHYLSKGSMIDSMPTLRGRNESPRTA